MVADPQLVDPHTYPGRPWPLSSLTETYTDMYMARNFRLINQDLDPDSVVFIGDLFDGGREWSTTRARHLKKYQREILVSLGMLDESEKEGTRLLGSGEGKEVDLRDYVHGEKGRWKKYSQKQWHSEYTRFGKIFFAPEQLYPHANRELLAAYDTPEDPVAVANGAPTMVWQEYATVGGKQKKVMTSLPGNHDLGFGSGVQVAVRDRFEAHFGETNNIYVLGNHTFVSLDVPSLSAYEEYNQEYTDQKRKDLEHIWKPTSDFMDRLEVSGSKVAAETLNGYFPGAHQVQGYRHEVLDSDKAGSHISSKESQKKPQFPVVLLTHVPLFRAHDADCGPHRERGHSIPIALGYQYQNVITPSLTTTIAQKVGAAGEIIQVFSGDDHDYCDLVHRFNVDRKAQHSSSKQWMEIANVREITLKSFSWAMGVRKPAFQLVSLWNPVDAQGNTIGSDPTIQSHLCLLPDQLGIFIHYALLLALTAAVLLVRGVVLSLRKPIPDEDEDGLADEAEKYALPIFTRYRSPSPLPQPNGRANGYSSPNKLLTNESKGRQRASSTSTSHGSNSTSNQNLSVQRSYNARTRSVSPGLNANGSGYGLPSGGGLIDKAGYYPSLRWQDPDEDSDEESHVGSHYDYGDAGDDSQAKGIKPKKKKRAMGKARIAVRWFLEGILTVAIPAGLFYGRMIRNG